PGGTLMIISPAGDVLRTLASREPGRSESIYLTIDSELQFIVQQALSDAYNVANWGTVARGASAVIMDVNTGEILALASYPSFDPNLFNPDNARFDAGDRLTELLNNERQPQINRVTQGQFAPGSTFKIITMIAAAESIYDLDRTLVCGGQWDGTRYGDILRDDWLLSGHGLLDLPGALTGSCDVYFYQAGADLYESDPDLLPNYAQRLGFGAPTGIQGLVEASGQVPNSQWARERGAIWRLSDSVNMSIGQGELLVTPLQMVRLVAAVANGGDLMVPQVVHHAQTLGEAPSYEFTPTVERNINVRAETLAAVREAMCEVTTNVTLGTAEYVFGSTSSLGGAVNFTVCGKTGTAQTGGENTPPHGWFAAFTPADDPQFAIVVMVENSREGSEVAAPIVRRILETYYNNADPTYPPNWWPPSWWTGEYVPLSTRGA
ncbi:MAG: hypothetical protein JW910_01715, partial [Anaerolineae bacterium]|nr:hypothetical protein [Anaerolineae bacterium]